MAEKRMFTQKIVDSDAFLDMPLSTQALYFHLNMRADDDGFINNPRKIQRMIGASDDDMKVLLVKRFLICFENGVIVIKHWRMHNTLKSDRYKPTQYQEQLALLELKPNKSYTEKAKEPAGSKVEPGWNQVGTGVEPQYRLGKDSIDKISLISGDDVCAATEENSISSPVEKLKTAVSAYSHKYFGRPATDYEQEEIRDIVAHMHQVVGEHLPPFRFEEDEEELLQLAFEAAAKAGAPNVGYINGVFRNMWNRGIHTVRDYYEYEVKNDKAFA